MPLNYDYSESKKYAKALGLHWLGDDFPMLVNFDQDAKLYALTQSQVNVVMRHHLGQTAYLFTPRSYRWWQRLGLAFYFLTGWGAK